MDNDLTVEFVNLAKGQGWDQETFEAAEDYLQGLVQGLEDPNPQGLTGRIISQLQELANRFAFAN